MKKLLLFLSFMMAITLASRADVIAFVANGASYTGNGEKVTIVNNSSSNIVGESFSSQDNLITLKHEKANSNNSAVNSNLVRWYANDILHFITPENIAIDKIVIECSTESYAKVSTTPATTYSNTTKSITLTDNQKKMSDFTLTAGAQIRFKYIEVTYTKLKDPAPIAFEGIENGGSKTISLVSDVVDDYWTAPALLGVEEGMTITYASSTDSVAMYDDEVGKFMIFGEGTTTITATSNETEKYAATTVGFTLNVLGKNEPTLTFDRELTDGKLTINLVDDVKNESWKNPVLATCAEGLPVVYSVSEDAKFIIVEGSEFMIDGTGTTTVTASVAETDLYAAKSISYELTVEKKQLEFVLTPAQTEYTINIGDRKAVAYAIPGIENLGEYTIVGSNDDTVATFDEATGEIVGVAAGTTEIQFIFDNNHAEANVTISVTVVDPNAPKVDVLNADMFGLSGSSYQSAHDKTCENGSGAVYAADMAKNNGMQINDGNTKSKGIVTTTSAGAVKKVTVKWNSATTNNRSLKIYASHEAYTAGTAPTATEITTLTIDKSNLTQSYTFEDYYEYVAFNTAGGVIYIDEIAIEWGAALPKPDFSFGEESISMKEGESREMPVLSYSEGINADAITFDVKGSAVSISEDGKSIIANRVEAESTATVTATFKGNGTFGHAEASFTVTVTPKQEAELSFANATESVFMLDFKDNALWADAPAVEGLPEGRSVVLTSSDDEVASIGENNEISIHKAGTTVITATMAADADYREATASYTLNVLLKLTEITFEPANNGNFYSFSKDGEQTQDLAVLINGADNDGTRVLDVTYSEEGIATWEGNALTLAGEEGIVELTFSLAANEYYEAGSATITVEVYDPAKPADTTDTFKFNFLTGTYGMTKNQMNTSTPWTDEATGMGFYVERVAESGNAFQLISSGLRFYSASEAMITISAPVHYAITKVEAVGDAISAMSVAEGEGDYSNGVWTGIRKVVKFTVNKPDKKNITSMTVTFCRQPEAPEHSYDEASKVISFTIPANEDGAHELQVSVYDGFYNPFNPENGKAATAPRRVAASDYNTDWTNTGLDRIEINAENDKTVVVRTLHTESRTPGGMVSYYTDPEGTTTGVDGVTVSATTGKVEFYTLQGIRVEAENLTPGFYIRRQGSAVSKILVR